MDLAGIREALVRWGPVSIEAAVLAGAGLVALRVATRRAALRELRAHPVLAVFAVSGGLAAVAAGFWLASRSPVTRSVLVGSVAVALLAAVVRSRPGYGRRRGLPPGSLGLARSLGAIPDPRALARSAARWGPIFKMSQFHRPVVCVTHLGTWIDFLRENDGALEQSDWSFNRLVPGGYLEYMNGSQHTRYRDVLLPAFSPAIVLGARGTMATAAREQLAAMAGTDTGRGLHPEPFLLPVPLVSLLQVVLGVEPPAGDEAGPVSSSAVSTPELRRRFTELNRPMELFLPAPRAARGHYRWLVEAVGALARERLESGSAGPGVPGPPSVLSNLIASDPSQVNGETVLGNLVLMVKEGSIMVRGLLRWVTKMLADHPEQVERIRAAEAVPERLTELTRHVVLETIRLYESPYLYRRTTKEVRLGSFRVPSGWMVRLCSAEAHRDPERFPDPDGFHPERFDAGGGSAPPHGTRPYTGLRPGRQPRSRPGPFGPTAFCPFGAGRHACLGGEVAIEIAQAFVRDAVLRYDLKTVADGPAWRINRHWGLWRPSRQWRVRVTPRTDGPDRPVPFVPRAVQSATPSEGEAP